MAKSLKTTQAAAATIASLKAMHAADLKDALQESSTKISLAELCGKATKQTEATIGLCLVEAGEALGTYTAADAWDRQTCGKQMDTALRAALRAGLTVDMLKAGRQAYHAFVDSIQNVRTLNDLEPLTNATRDNYMSRIRSFVAARGANPLDVFGNLKAAAQKAAKKAATPAAVKKDDAPKDTDDAPKDTDDAPKDTDAAPKQAAPEVNLLGAPALGKFLACWIEANAGNGSMTKIYAMAKDLLHQVNVATGTLK